MEHSQWLTGFPGLLWQIEHRRSRIKLLNAWEIPALGEDTSRIIKDAQFRKRMVEKSDLPLLAEFWDMMTSRQPAAVSFHLSGSPNIPYMLQGWPSSQNQDFYFGMLKEAVLPAAFVANGMAGTCQLALGNIQYPVLVLSLRQQEIVTCNQAAQELFINAARQADYFTLEDIAPGELIKPLMQAARAAVADDVWAGTLMLRCGTGGILGSKVRISPCSSESDIVRIALLNIPDRPAMCSVVPQREVQEHFSLKHELEKLMKLCPQVDGLMFSDIQSTVGKVEVYGVGRLFSSLKWGDAHAYEGTIAQDIERFSLDSLTVEDTLDSIKSIDWAMFIPCGVRSYFAKPFYSAHGLHAVLIAAFEKPNAGMANEYALRPLFAPFDQLVAAWRRKEKKA